MGSVIELSVIVPVTERYDDVRGVYSAYKSNLDAIGIAYEFIYVLDGYYPSVEEQLKELRRQGEPIIIIKLAKWFGEATALSVGFEHSSGPTVLTLPPYLQVAPEELPRLVASLQEHDMVVACRWPRRDSILNKAQSAVFHLLLRSLTDLDFHDLGCGVRVIRRRVIDEIQIYGDQHRFLPLLASRQGFKVAEVQARQAAEDAKQRIYAPGVYLRRMLDILAIFFLLKFTKKPLRFFGLLGSSLFVLGAGVGVYLAVERLFFDVSLADRPLLLLASLLVVLGVQVFAIGLIGEIIIFTHAKDIKEYTVEEIVN